MNWPTFIVAAIIAVIFIAIIVVSIRNKKKGKSSCSCGSGCSGCAMSEYCHAEKKQNNH